MRGMTKQPEQPKPRPAILQVKVLDPDFLKKLDDLRLGRTDFATRSDIIRELVDEAHKARKPKR